MALFENLTQEQKRKVTQGAYLIASAIITRNVVDIMQKQFINDSDQSYSYANIGLTALVLFKIVRNNAGNALVDNLIAIAENRMATTPFIQLHQDEKDKATRIGQMLGMSLAVFLNDFIESPEKIFDNPEVKNVLEQNQDLFNRLPL